MNIAYIPSCSTNRYQIIGIYVHYKDGIRGGIALASSYLLLSCYGDYFVCTISTGKDIPDSLVLLMDSKLCFEDFIPLSKGLYTDVGMIVRT